MVWCQLLGGTALEGPAGPVTGPAAQRHRLALLALLAVARGEGIRRDKLVACLWPERDADHARNLLNQAVHALRRALGEPAIRSHGDTLHLDPTLVPTDLGAFEQAVDRRDWRQAVEQYRGPFLDGFFLPDAPEFEQWVDGERTRLAGMYQAALEALAREAAEAGDAAEAVRWWQRLAAEDRLSSRIALGLMEALAASGDRAAAIQHAHLHARLLHEELGAAPDPEVEALADLLRSPASAPAPPLVARPAEPEPSPGTGTMPPARPPADGPTSETEPPELHAADGTAPPRRWLVRLGAAAVFAVLLVAAIAALRNPAGPDQGPASLQRIAVLPPESPGASADQEYFASATHQALISELSQVPGLEVTSRQSVLRYRGSTASMAEIGAELGVGALVEADVFQVQDSVRISVRLVGANPETHLWGESFEGGLGSGLGLQRKAASAIAAAVRRLAGAAAPPAPLAVPSVQPDAQDAYFRGLYELTRQEGIGPMPPAERAQAVREAIRQFQEAVRIEPAWAEAHARLASAYGWLGGGFPTRPASDTFLPLSRASAERALALDSTNATAHAALGAVLLAWELDFPGAERHLRRAVALQATADKLELLGSLLRRSGRAAEAMPFYDLAVERNPLSERLHWARLQTYECAGRHEDAVRLADDHIERFGSLVEEALPGIHSFKAHGYSWLGLHEQAIREQEQSLSLSGGSPWQVGNLAFILARSGRTAEARRLLEDLDAAGTTPPVPQLFAVLGDTARALEEYVRWATSDPRSFVLRLECTVGYQLLGNHPRLEGLRTEAMEAARRRR